MYLIAFFGFLMMTLSLLMVVNPEYWAEGIVKFSRKSYFHPFEIISRLIFGLIFILYADTTSYPMLMLAIGYLLVVVGIGLSLTPPSKHKQFAVWSAQKFIKYFRTAGICSFLCGLFIVYASFK